MDKFVMPMKKLTKMLAEPSYKFIADFINDTGEKKAQEQAANEIFLQLKKAALQKNLVVLQVEDPDEAHFQTVTGWLAGRNVETSVVVRTQETQELILIPLERIKKVSTQQLREDEYRLTQ